MSNKNIRFKLGYKPVNDDDIMRHKDFGMLMATYAVAPKVSIMDKLAHNRLFLVGTGLVAGVSLTTFVYMKKLDQNREVRGQRLEVRAPGIKVKSISKAQKPTNNDQESINNNQSSIINGQREARKEILLEKSIKKDKSVVFYPSIIVKEQPVAVKEEEKMVTVENKVEPVKDLVSNDKLAEKTQDEIVESKVLVPEKDIAVQNNARVESPNIWLGKDSGIVEKDQISTIKKDTGFALKLDSTVTKASQNLKKAVVKLRDEISPQVLTKADSIANKLDSVTVKVQHSMEKIIERSKRKSAKKDSVESNTTYVDRYAQVSFITPLSTNGPDGSKYLHHISLNVLQGNTGALEGVEFGGLANMNKGYMKGVQFGGLMNYVGGDVSGAQFGGLLNTSRSLKGAQFAGIANINQKSGFGVQTAGVLNLNATGKKFSGWQIAGVSNVTGSEMDGIQLSGAVNISIKELEGGQISGAINISNVHKGFQLGVVNFSRKIDGFQFGVINIADTIKGGSFGLINLSRNGQFSVDLWASENFLFNGGLKLGNTAVYNEFAFGISPLNNKISDTAVSYKSLPFGFGYGIGTHIPIKKAFVNIDGMTWMIHDRYFSFAGINMLNQLRTTVGFEVSKYFGIYAGPVFNVSIQDKIYKPIHEKGLFEYTIPNNVVKGWIGFVAGVQLF